MKAPLTPKVILLLVLLVFLFFLNGCTEGDTLIIQNSKLTKVLDVNDLNGTQGQIPFMNQDGNLLDLSSALDFNKDTNALGLNTGKVFVDVNGDWVFCDNNSGC